MAGHSKWHSIRHKKAANDAKMGKIFTKHAKLITIAARDGGGDPDSNPALRTAITNAKADNVPNNNIDRAIKKGTGAGADAVQMEEIYYEGFGPEGVAVYVHAITDNRNRSFTNIRTVFNKNGGNLGQAGSVGYIFDLKGMLTVPLAGKDADELQLEFIELGAEDFVTTEDELIVYTEYAQLNEVTEAVKAAGYTVKKSELTHLPNQTIAITDEKLQEKILNFIEKVEDDEDVQSVYCNVDLQV